MIKRIFILSSIIFCFFGCGTQKPINFTEITSPDGSLVLKVNNEKSQLFYTLFKNGNQIIDSSKAQGFRAKIDKILTHKIFGYLIFLMVLMAIFQSIYEWASVPMDLVDSSFASLADWVKINFPSGEYDGDVSIEGWLVIL